MRVVKMRLSMVIEGLMPIPEAEHEDFPVGALSEENAQKLRDGVLPDLRKEYSSQGQRLIEADIAAEVVEV